MRYAEADADRATSFEDDATAYRLLKDAVAVQGLPAPTRVRLASKLATPALHCLEQDDAIEILRPLVDDNTLTSGLRGELRFRLGNLLYQAGDAAASDAEIARAVTELRRRPALAARAMAHLATPRSTHGDIDEHLRWLDRAVDVAAETNDRALRIRLVGERAAILLSRGDLLGWEAAAEVPAPGASPDDEKAAVRAWGNLTDTLLHLGHYRPADEFWRRALDLSTQSDYARNTTMLKVTRLQLDWLLGNWNDVEERAPHYIGAWQDWTQLRQVAETVLGLLSLARGEVRNALHLLEPLTEGIPGEIPLQPWVAGGLARIRLALGESDAAVGEGKRALAAVEVVPNPSVFSVPKRDLVTVDSTYHAVRPAWIGGGWGAVDVDGVGVGGAFADISMAGPVKRTEYLYPASRKLVWVHRAVDVDTTFPDESREESLATVFTRPERRTEHWLTGPRVPGAFRIPPEVSSLGDDWNGTAAGGFCTFCRGQFLLGTLWMGVSGDTYRHQGNFFEDAEAHLFRNGQEIPPIFPGLPLFDVSLLPPEPARYVLTQRHQPLSFIADASSEVTTTWEFTSRAAIAHEAPRGVLCVDEEAPGDPTLPCRVEPLLLLGYDLSDSLDLDNTIRADRAADFDVRVYQQDGALRSRVKGFELEVSFDRGEHWQAPKRVRSRGNGRYEVSVKHPELRKTSGTVSLHTIAWDDAGNRVEQTILDAYALR